MKFMPLKLGRVTKWENYETARERHQDITVGGFRVARLTQTDCKESHLFGQGMRWYLSLPYRQGSKVYETRDEALRCITL